MKFKFLKALLVTLTAISASYAQAGIITFEPNNGFLDFGFSTTNIYTTFANPYGSNSGYDAVFNSGNNVGYAFNTTDISHAQDFDFNGVYLASAWDTQFNITIRGFNNGVQLYSDTVNVTRANSLWFVANFSGVDQVTFSWSGQQLAVEDFTFNQTVSVPEPSTLAIFALGLMGLASRRLKKQS